MGPHLIKAALFCPICFSIQLPFESSLFLVHDFNHLIYISDMLPIQVSHSDCPPFYLIHSSSEGLSDSSSSLSSSSGRSPHRSKFRPAVRNLAWVKTQLLLRESREGSYWPVESSLLSVDTASLLNIQKWPLLQESRQGLHGATTW